MKSNLRIEKALLKYLDDTLSTCKQDEFILAVLKGELNDKPPATWGATIIPADTANDMITSGEASYVEIESRNIFVYPTSLLCELENKKISWNDSGMELVPVV